MQEKNYTGIIPTQELGSAIDVTAHAAFETIEEAKTFFQEAQNRLLHINDWHKIAGTLSATFHLTNNHGEEIEGAAKEGCYLKIDIPGPGTATGMGYDWVIIESIENVSTTSLLLNVLYVRNRQLGQSPHKPHAFVPSGALRYLA